ATLDSLNPQLALGNRKTWLIPSLFLQMQPLKSNSSSFLKVKQVG
ncbi:hypothetical protein LINGRAHAP2_LOCUS32868, partial [Linum grandiflorum]